MPKYIAVYILIFLSNFNLINMPKIPVKKEFKDIGAIAAAYLTIKNKIADATTEMDGYKATLKEYLDQEGKKDTKGSFLAEVQHAGVTFELKKELRVSQKQDPDIISILKKEAPKEVVSRVIEKVEIVREDVLEIMQEQGKISDALLAKLYTEVKNYAFKMKKI